MDIKGFFKLIYRYKWLLILVPIVAVTVTYFLVQNLPKQYSSKVQISTGLLDPSKKVITNQGVDYYQVSLQFSTIMEKMKMKKVINILSYNLILHDLYDKNNSFRPYSPQLDSLSEKEKSRVVELLSNKLKNKEILTLADNKGKEKLYDLVASMGYGENVFVDDLEITHIENSDFINVEYTSENPELSAYVVNTLALEFIANYSGDVTTNQANSLTMLDSLLKKKEVAMNQKNESLSTFKRTKGVLNLEGQSATVYSQISAYETQLAQALREIQANQGAIAIIEGKLRGSDPYVAGSNRTENREILNLKRQLEIANSDLIDNNFRPGDQKKVDSLTRILSARGIKNSDENVLDPRSSKQSLVQQKIGLEVTMQQAKSSIKSLNSELGILRARYQNMVPYDADIQNYEREAELATKEYMTALDTYNQNRTGQGMGLRLQIEQMGLPGNAEPSKRMIYLAGAGAGSLAISLGFVFLLFVMDRKITNSRQLELATGSKTLAVINLIDSNERAIRDIWNNAATNDNLKLFKEYLRALRFEISNKMDSDNAKILGVTSLNSNAGKTFLSYSLAYAFAMTGKKILLIADEQSVATPNSRALTSQSFQTFLVKKEVLVEDLITVMNKTSEKNSLLEIQNVKNLRTGFEILCDQFDLIIIDVNSLNELNIAKEWLLFTECNIAVFESGNTINESERKYVEYIKEQPGFLGWVLNKFLQ